MRRVDVRVTGHVQGVFFRASTRDEALRLGVRGTVRNEPDGSVFIQAEGEDEAVERFLRWVENGPPHARVDRVDVTGGPAGDFRGFEIAG
ncbi:MAG TPA: acylphosphatase [bacterium]|nr:acylphosphatase [bacterium]